MDEKCGVCAMEEVCEILIRQGFTHEQLEELHVAAAIITAFVYQTASAVPEEILFPLFRLIGAKCVALCSDIESEVGYTKEFIDQVDEFVVRCLVVYAADFERRIQPILEDIVNEPRNTRG